MFYNGCYDQHSSSLMGNEIQSTIYDMTTTPGSTVCKDPDENENK